MDSRDMNLPAGSFGDVDARDTHPTPGDEKQPYPPIEAPSDAIYGGATPTMPANQTGAGGNIEGDVRRRSDGYEINPPEGDYEADPAKGRTGGDSPEDDDGQHV